MGEYEPNDSRAVTLKQQPAPGEPPRTGPREGETRQQEQQLTELEQDERDDASKRERSIELDEDELDDEFDAGERPHA